jgi:signal peptidase I
MTARGRAIFRRDAFSGQASGFNLCLFVGRGHTTMMTVPEMDSELSTAAKPGRLPRWLRTVLIGRKPGRTAVRIVFLVAGAAGVSLFVLLPIRVSGPSMLPTYQDHGINFVNRLAYLRSEPKRGDVVAIRLSNPSPWPPSIMFMKRVVGLPGETLRFHEGRLQVNGRILEEPYVKQPCDWETDERTLPAGWYYVVGDNRSMPEMLHEEGKTHRSRIVGRILLCKNLFASSSPPR